MSKQIQSTNTAPKRFIIEGEWGGYHSGQQRIVHRTVHKPAFKKLRAWAEKAHGIRFTDGTMLYLKVRDCKPRERVQQIKGYASLISDCAMYGVSSVDELQASRSELRKSA